MNQRAPFSKTGWQWVPSDKMPEQWGPIAQLLCISAIQEFSFIERIEAMFAIIQEDAAASCNQSPAFPGNAPSE